jgi:NitT/TauT family transport system substrate-binding protein
VKYRSWWLIAAFMFLVSTNCQNAGAQTLRIGVQKTGTFAWQLDVIARHGLARQRGLDFSIQEFASLEGSKIALNSGTIDVAVVDWVARERALGRAIKYYPYSTAVGAVMVKGDSPLRELSDLKGRSLAVAGGAASFRTLRDDRSPWRVVRSTRVGS